MSTGPSAGSMHRSPPATRGLATSPTRPRRPSCRSSLRRRGNRADGLQGAMRSVCGLNPRNLRHETVDRCQASAARGDRHQRLGNSSRAASSTRAQAAISNSTGQQPGGGQSQRRPGRARPLTTAQRNCCCWTVEAPSPQPSRSARCRECQQFRAGERSTHPHSRPAAARRHLAGNSPLAILGGRAAAP